MVELTSLSQICWDELERFSFHPSPADWRDHPIYFLLVDRFNRFAPGEPELPLYDADTTPRSPRDETAGDKWQGGNLQGITQKLEYIKTLGCTAIWLSPIFKNRAEMDTYHGYGIQNFLDVDPRFGTLADLRELVDQAHARGMYVILDIVINHTGDNFGYSGDHPAGARPCTFSRERYDFGFWRLAAAPLDTFLDPPAHWPDDGVWPVEFQNPDWYTRQGALDDWHAPEQVRHADFGSLKKLDTTNHAILNALIQVYKFWVALADIDGFRLDAIKHVEDSSTAIFCNAIREYAQKIGKQNFFLFGEIAASDRHIAPYIGRHARILGSTEYLPALDAALDFPLWSVLEGVIKGLEPPDTLRERYERFKTLYPDHGHAGGYFITFVDNHDQVGRLKRFLHDNPYKQQAVLAIGYLLTSMGVPCVYYGTEQGFDGGGDHDKYVRECMFGGTWGAFGTEGHHFFDPTHPLYQAISKVIGVRRREPALRYGRQYFREISGNGTDFGFPTSGDCTLAYSRILDDTEILIAMNLNREGRRADHITVDMNLTPAGAYLTNLLRPGSRFYVKKTGMRANVQVELEPLEMAILKLARHGPGG